MTTLRDAATLTARLEALSSDLHAELTERDADFSRMVSIADQVRDHAEALSATFARIDETLARELDALAPVRGGNG